MVRVPTSEGYHQIAHKVLLGLAWAVRHRPALYYMKTDDDAFLCIGGILSLLRSASHKYRQSTLGLYAGQLESEHLQIQLRNPATRWFNPQHYAIFGRKRYAPYMQGGGYLLSAALARVVVGEARRKLGLLWSHAEEPSVQATGLKLPTVEDALVGQLICSSAEGVCSSQTGVIYLELARHIWSSSPAFTSNASTRHGTSEERRPGNLNYTDLDASRLCAICSGVGMLVVHPLKSQGALLRCAHCSGRKQPERCSNLLMGQQQPHFRVETRTMREHELCCRHKGAVRTGLHTSPSLSAGSLVPVAS